VRWLRLGIGIERIMPGNPQQNGRHERMHLTLKREATKLPGKTSCSSGQVRSHDFNVWEGDLVEGSRGTYIATLGERQSRFVIIAKVA